MNRRQLVSLAGGLAALSWVPEVLAAEKLAIVVHPSNKEGLSVGDLAAMFTTRKQSWGDGNRVVPFNFPPKHDVRVAFDRTVLHMEPDDVARYWIDRRIRGGNAPPKQVASAQLIVRLVEKLEGAIGYVPVSAVTSAVRVALTI